MLPIVLAIIGAGATIAGFVSENIFMIVTSGCIVGAAIALAIPK